MKIRLTGLPEEIHQAIEALHDTRDLDITEVSGPYPNRGTSRLVRAYLDARLRHWCGRSWHDGTCCEGSRNQQHPATAYPQDGDQA